MEYLRNSKNYVDLYHLKRILQYQKYYEQEIKKRSKVKNLLLATQQPHNYSQKYIPLSTSNQYFHAGILP